MVKTKEQTIVVLLLTTIIAVTLFLSAVFNLGITGAAVIGDSKSITVAGVGFPVIKIDGSVVVLIYLFLGGFNAVVITDIFQYLLMLFITIVIGISFTQGTTFLPEQLEPFRAGGALVFGLILFGVLSVVGSPELWQRIYAAKDDKTIKYGMTISSLLVGVIAIGLTLIVMATRAKFADLVPEQALAYGFINVLPPVILGFGLVLLFATIMSSADTLIFALSTIVGKNILRHHDKLKPEEFKNITRGAIIGVTVFAAILAYMFPNIIKVYTVIANVLFALAPSIIGTFHWKLKRKAVLLSIGSGIATLLVFIAFNILRVEIAALSFFVSLIGLIVGQMLFKK